MFLLSTQYPKTLSYTLSPTPTPSLLDPDRLDIHELAYAELA
jgi:hypothetical protein